MNFRSDNVVPAHPQILEALVKANSDPQSSYGHDAFSQELRQKLCELFETDVFVWLTSTGTAANCLALSTLCEQRGSIYCHHDAHIFNEEGGAPEFFTGGAKLVAVGGDHSKLSKAEVEAHIVHALEMRPHLQRPACMSITQATESGTIYTPAELQAIHQLAQTYDLPIHMDGARFTNALVSLGCTPAEMTWKVGVDALSFGATKNGTLSAEAVIFFDERWAQRAEYLHKQFGQLMSKTRYAAAQFLGYFDKDLWLTNAQHANAQAQALAAVFQKKTITPVHPVQANEVFVSLPKATAQKLSDAGVGFYQWGQAQYNLYRFVTSYCTSDADIQRFAAALG